MENNFKFQKIDVICEVCVHAYCGLDETPCITCIANPDNKEDTKE